MLQKSIEMEGQITQVERIDDRRIRYDYEGGDGYTIYEVDWNWEQRDRWARSEREGVRWYVISGIDEIAREAIIKAFGLENHRDKLTIEKLVSMAPSELLKLSEK